MKIAKAYPPNYDAICEAIPSVRTKKTIVFAYGDTLYIPSGGDAPTHLLRHEETHEKQQAEMGIEAWWSRYLADPEFRLSQEIEAYQNQWKSLIQTYDRPTRRRVLSALANDLSGSMYGKLVTKLQARRLIIGGEHEAV